MTIENSGRNGKGKKKNIGKGQYGIMANGHGASVVIQGTKDDGKKLKRSRASITEQKQDSKDR